MPCPCRSAAVELIFNPRWSRTEESPDFFIDEDGLRRWFYCLLAAGSALLATLGAGLWRLRQAALAPPVFVGIAHGLVFSGHPEGIAAVREDDFDQQLADTVEVLFSRTEKGRRRRHRGVLLPGSGRRSRPGLPGCREQVSGRLCPKPGAPGSQGRGQPAGPPPSVLPGTAFFAIGGGGPDEPHLSGYVRENARLRPRRMAGWRLVQADALSRDDFYRSERERAARATLELAPKP